MNLVDRLRHQAGCLDSDLYGRDIDLLNEAADEIERLREKVTELSDEAYEYAEQVERLTREGK